MISNFTHECPGCKKRIDIIKDGKLENLSVCPLCGYLMTVVDIYTIMNAHHQAVMVEVLSE